MASQAQISSLQAALSVDTPVRMTTKNQSALSGNQSVPLRNHGAHLAQDAVIAHSLEFVALPGRAVDIQAEIPMAMRHAFRDVNGFMGSMVLVSEQEARLVTVITLWTGSRRIELCNACEKRLKRWLAPYIDRSLHARRFASFVAAPDRFLVGDHPHANDSSRENSLHLQ